MMEVMRVFVDKLWGVCHRLKLQLTVALMSSNKKYITAHWKHLAVRTVQAWDMFNKADS